MIRAEVGHNEDPGSVPQALGRLRVALQDTYQRCGRELGLTAPQAELLCAAMNPAGIGDIAAVLRCDRSNVTRLVDRAAGRGLLRRSPDDLDGRVTVIELSPKGRMLAERFIASLEAQLGPLVGGWSADRRQATAQGLNEISDCLDKRRPKTSKPTRRPAHNSSGTLKEPDGRVHDYAGALVEVALPYAEDGP